MPFRRATPRGLAHRVVLAAATATAGCAGAAPALQLPADPTPLARCRVAASGTSPLVTEWPATEKSRLEGLLSGGAIAVSYAGCEMRVLPECKLAGRYELARTTVSSDTVEIATEDELYAKLPLGAASLEGELRRSGHLAVRTTVAGQFVLDGAPPEVPRDPACAGATHVVRSLSVGAFKLVSGGSSRARGGVAVGPASAGVATGGTETVMREAGDAARCAGDDAGTQCSSPIQVFLSRARADAPSEGPLPVTTERERADRAAHHVLFSPPSAERWTLLGGDGQPVCELPCARWVSPGSGLSLYRDGATVEEVKKLSFPGLAYTPGTEVTAVPLAKRGDPGVAGALALPGIVALGTATPVLIGACAGADQSRGACIALPIVAGAGALLLAAGLFYRFAYVRTEDTIEVSLPPSASSPSALRSGRTRGGRTVEIAVAPGAIAGRY